MKPEVYFIKGFDEKSEKRFLETLKSEISKVFKKNENIAIKLHMGEGKNFNNLQPDFVAKIVQVFKKLEINCFLFDSPTGYKLARHTVKGYENLAEQRGYTKIAQVVISNDSIDVKGKYLTYHVCKPLIDADGVLVLSHVKGHECAGFGACLKNLGMGALTRESKNMIHDGGKPVFDSSKCTGCGICQEKCPTKNIKINEKTKKAEFGDLCYGCSNCSIYCPQKANKPRVNYFDKLLADGANAALSSFKKYYCVNVLRTIAKLCDCCHATKPIAQDQGILLSRDIVAIDKAAFDLIVKKEGRDIFYELLHKSPLEHIKEAHALGMGSMDYQFVEK